MITYEEALNKARELKKNVNHCIEYTNGYVFGSSEDEGYTGGFGHTPRVIMKEDGKVLHMNEYVIQGPGTIIREFDV